MTFVRALFEKRFPDRLVRKEGDIAVTYLFAEGFGFHHIFFFQKGRNYDYWRKNQSCKRSKGSDH